MGASTSLVQRTRQAKINALTGKIALAIAKAHNDPVYKKYTRLNRKRLLLKRLIAKRYHAQAIQIARKTLGSSGKKSGKK